VNLCAVLLAAGIGSRLRPLTELRPKALCPVGNRPMLDRLLDLLAPLRLAGPDTVAVNACWLGDQVAAHLTAGGTARAYVSMERPPPLGTAGGLGNLRDWIAGRPTLVGNADAYLSGAGLERLVTGWDRESVRLLGVPAAPGTVDAFGGYRFAGFSLLPWRWVRELPAAPGELVSAVWRPAEAAGELAVVRYDGHFRDTGTVADYLAANRHAAAGANLFADGATVTGDCHESVVGAGAEVHGRLTRAVVWPGGYVGASEHLTDAVRAGETLTVTAAGDDRAPR
jgi:NDP-sugar pyrophosphorylase family protein